MSVDCDAMRCGCGSSCSHCLQLYRQEGSVTVGQGGQANEMRWR